MITRGFLYIDYDEFDQESYRAVVLNVGLALGDEEYQFETGDPVADMAAAWNKAEELATKQNKPFNVAYSSSCDAFLSDGEKYEYDINSRYQLATGMAWRTQEYMDSLDD